MVRVVMLVGCLGCLIWATGADSRPAAGWSDLAPGVREMKRRNTGQGIQIPAEIHALEVDLRVAKLGVVDVRQHGRKRASAEAMRQIVGALAVANASFFEPSLEPMGLLIHERQQLNPKRKADWGVFYVDDQHRARIVHTKDWGRSEGAAAELAIQAGPRLVVDGKPTTLKPSLARRTALCIPGDGNGKADEQRVIVLASKQPMLLGAFARLLAREPADGGFGCRYALNLDGGSSTQLAVSGSNLGLGIRGLDEVPIGIAVFGGEAPADTGLQLPVP